MEGKTIIRSLTPHAFSFPIVIDGVAKLVKIPAGHDKKNVVVIDNAEFDLIKTHIVFQSLEREKKILFLDEIPASFIDPLEAIANERVKTNEALDKASKSEQDKQAMAKEIDELKKKLADNGVK